MYAYEYIVCANTVHLYRIAQNSVMNSMLMLVQQMQIDFYKNRHLILFPFLHRNSTLCLFRFANDLKEIRNRFSQQRHPWFCFDLISFSFCISINYCRCSLLFPWFSFIDAMRSFVIVFVFVFVSILLCLILFILFQFHLNFNFKETSRGKNGFLFHFIARFLF